MTKFEKLGLSKDVAKTLEKLGIVEPTEIQKKSIPILLKGEDIIAGSATGSGKTLAFSAPIIEKIKSGKGIQALILTPTRELAEQITDSIRSFSTRDLSILSVYGGVPIDRQIRHMGRTDIVVGTPGRILDHLNKRTLNLRQVKFLVLDEFDRMLDMGFQRDVGKIILECPKERQSMLFSATISADVEYLSKKYTKNPREIEVEQYVDHSKLKQVYYDTPDGLKFSALVHLLNHEETGLVMIFCNTRRNADFIVQNLNKLKIEAKAIHGGLEQKKRTKILGEFHHKGVGVLVCTDVAARGLDIKGVSHVYNYDLPKTKDEYVHRIGRTARAGKKGIAISILASRDYESFSNINNNLDKKIEQVKLPYLEKINVSFDRDKGRLGGRIFGNRASGRRDSRSSGGSRFGSRDSRGGSRSPRNDNRFGSSRDRKGDRDSRDGRSVGNSGRRDSGSSGGSRFGNSRDSGPSSSRFGSSRDSRPSGSRDSRRRSRSPSDSRSYGRRR